MTELEIVKRDITRGSVRRQSGHPLREAGEFPLSTGLKYFSIVVEGQVHDCARMHRVSECRHGRGEPDWL